jgi:hypothetical protein
MPRFCLRFNFSLLKRTVSPVNCKVLLTARRQERLDTSALDYQMTTAGKND